MRPNTSPPAETRVVVAMSGGVDSSVAAALLVEQGYDVVGMMMRLWSEPGASDSPFVNRCCTPDQVVDAQRVADLLDIPFFVIDVQEHFRQTIVQFFLDEHAQGRTPNPCLECNRQIRFTYLLNRALALDAQFLATGHYARIRWADGRYRLFQAVDKHKDQAYVLHMLTQEHLSHVLLPIGNFNKKDVRTLARRFGLPVASKHDSQDLCFLKDGDYRRFLQEHDGERMHPGLILDKNDQPLGHHNGLPFYTIGQRKGLGLTSPEPLFVLRKDAQRNALIVGPRQQLGGLELTANQVNWMAGTMPESPIKAQVKIRYKAVPVDAVVTPLTDGQVHIRFSLPVAGITPGQGAVFFDGEECIGGGIITD